MPSPRKPVSQKQLAANRANAVKSTGPRTPEGKARSSQNARKHGFTASTFAVVRLEDLDEIAHLRADLIAVYRPVNSQELFAIERIALSQKQLAANRANATTCLNEALDSTGNPVVPMDEDSTAWSSSPTVGPWLFATRPRRSATTAAPSRSSTGSKPCGPNYQMSPCSTPNPNQRKPLARM